MPTFFHTTANAEAIVVGGFRDGEGSYGFAHNTLRGVFVARHPAGISDGAKGSAVIRVRLPESFDATPFAIEEKGHPPWEWCIPADILNELAEVRILSDEEVDKVMGDIGLAAPEGLPDVDFGALRTADEPPVPD